MDWNYPERNDVLGSLGGADLVFYRSVHPGEFYTTAEPYASSNDGLCWTFKRSCRSEHR